MTWCSQRKPREKERIFHKATDNLQTQHNRQNETAHLDKRPVAWDVGLREPLVPSAQYRKRMALRSENIIAINQKWIIEEKK